jgi:hypothetical protein
MRCRVWLWGVLAMATSSAALAQLAAPRGDVIFPDRTRVSAEIAATPEARQRGLMFRNALGPDEGMVFVFDQPGPHAFWMKNTLIPLDIIWLAADRRIVHIAHSVPPCKADPCPSYPPAADTAVYVLEVASGVARRHALGVGDVLQFRGIGAPPATTPR